MVESAQIRIDALRKCYGDVEAVADLSLEIRQGETFGLLGPNGAGKTTTLSVLATLVEPSGGDVEIGGYSLRSDPIPIKRLVGLAPQQISLYPSLSAEENLTFFGRLHGLSRAELGPRVDRLLDLVGLQGRRRDRVETYSGGMQRRLNLACSLVHGPRVLLLDEPTVGVDPQSRDNIFGAVRRLAEEGVTVVYTTHYMEEAERLCDRIAILDAGRVVAQGSLTELLEIVGMGEVIEVYTAGVLAVEKLREIPDVVDVEPNGNFTRIFARNAARTLAPLSEVLAAQADVVERIEIYPVNLDRVFMHLTGRALRD